MENTLKTMGPREEYIDFDYEEIALETIRKEFPDARHSCFSGRYITGYNHKDEHVFLDRAGIWMKGWVPNALEMSEEEFVDLLIKEGTYRLKNNITLRFSQFDKSFK